MAINLQLVGEKIRLYREQLQLSLDELSQSIGMAKEKLTQIEAGEKEPTGDEIAQIANKRNNAERVMPKTAIGG